MCRAIFRWLTAKNLYSIIFDSQLPGSPEQLIMAFRDGNVSYAKIFECLATYVCIKGKKVIFPSFGCLCFCPPFLAFVNDM